MRFSPRRRNEAATNSNQIMSRFSNSELRKLCTGKPTPSPGYHPSHKCKDVYLASPTEGFVCHYANNPAELKSRLAWHKEAMTEWLADPLKRLCLVREILENLLESREEAIRFASTYHSTKFIEGGRLFFVWKESRHGQSGVSISQL